MIIYLIERVVDLALQPMGTYLRRRGVDVPLLHLHSLLKIVLWLKRSNAAAFLQYAVCAQNGKYSY
jgi:hypothetical protein